jgi:hypothetical protein
MADRYTVYKGKFVCHTCKKDVPNMRYYFASKDMTWVCADNHMTRVSLQTKKKKKRDYDREI